MSRDKRNSTQKQLSHKDENDRSVIFRTQRKKKKEPTAILPASNHWCVKFNKELKHTL